MSSLVAICYLHPIRSLPPNAIVYPSALMSPRWIWLALVALTGVGARSHGEYALAEDITSVPFGWIKESPASPAETMEFRIAPKLDRLDEFQQKVADLSTPGHPTYGQFMTPDQIQEFFQPEALVTNAILSWLADEDVPASSIEHRGDWIKFAVPIAQAERMMWTRFHYFQHADSGVRKTRTLAYSVPLSVAPYIETIQPTTIFTQAGMGTKSLVGRLQARDTNTSPDCGDVIVPECLRQLYDFASYRPSTNAGNSIAVTGYLEEYANRDDLQQFYAQYEPDAVNSTFEFVSIHGGRNDQDRSASGIEAALDVQYAFSLTYPIPATFYSTGGRPPFHPDIDTPTNNNEPYADFLDYVLSLDNPPLVISTSYGDPEQTVPRAYARRVCAQFAQLGARGVSLLFSSGDDGAGKTCLTNDGRKTPHFTPSFPSTCPFVTSVGGTYRTNPEQAISLSQGGFSDYFTRPSYQDDAVSDYLRNIPRQQWSGLFNRDGRGFPDVAAQSTRYSIVHMGQMKAIGGTRYVHPTGRC